MSAGSMICMGCHLQLARRRGLCDWCHRRTRRKVSAGKITWAELQRRGLVLAAEEGDYDLDEGEQPALAADLVGWFVQFGIGLVFASAGLVLWSAANDPPAGVGVLCFVLGVAAMLHVLALAVARCHWLKQ